MLTAITKTNKKVCLGYDYKKETLLTLRRKEEFFCPVCGDAVLLKLGDQRIFHFAHKNGGTCRDFYENESTYHMEGKRQLYQWLIHQKIPSVLEYYDREIQQRPDVMFKYNGKKYALEYQCSPIPDKVFCKRTESYLVNGYIPLWIMGSTHIQQKRSNFVSLSNFHYLFLRHTSDGTLYIPSYCSEKHLFHFLGHILSYSIKNAFVQRSLVPPNQINVNGLLNPKLNEQIQIDNWNTELEQIKYHLSLHPSPQQYPFLHELYNRNLNLLLLPLEIGLPVRHSSLIQTSPIIWQTYIFLDTLSKKQPQEAFHLQEVERNFQKRVARKDIIIRNLPQMERVTPFAAIIEYMLQLEKLEIVEQKDETIFQWKRNLIIPKSNREKEEMRGTFYQKYHRSFSKI